MASTFTNLLRKKTLKEEFAELLKRHNIELDERYVFEEEHIA